MNLIKLVSVLLVAIAFTACNNEQSLQQYYVENQGDKEFVAIDVPTSLFANTESLTADQKNTLETVKKINIIAIPNKEENKLKIDQEKKKLTKILKDEKYQLLMKFGGNAHKIEVYYTGNEEAVNEIILYGFDEKKGVGIARVLGDKMNPSDILKLVRSLDKGEIDVEGLSGITTMLSRSDM